MHAQDALNLHILCLFEGTFSLDTVHMLLQTRYQLADHTVMFDEAVKPYCWFLLPSEAAECFAGKFVQSSTQLPFCPPHHRQALGLPDFVGSCNDDCDVTDFIISSEHDTRTSRQVHLGEKFMNKTSESQIEEVYSLEKGTSSVKSYSYGNEQVLPEKLLAHSSSIASLTKENKYNIGSDVAAEKNICSQISSENINKQDMKEDKSVCVNNVCVDNSVGSTIITSCCEDSNSEHADKRTVEENLAAGDSERTESCTDREARKRKTTGDEVQVKEVAKRSKDKEEGEGREKKGKRKDSKWYSPPKTIFAPFLKVSLVSIVSAVLGMNTRKLSELFTPYLLTILVLKLEQFCFHLPVIPVHV